MVNTRRERLSAFRTTLAQYPGVIAQNAEVPLTDNTQLDDTLRQFHQQLPLLRLLRPLRLLRLYRLLR